MIVSEKIRVLHVIPDLKKGGGQKFLLDICYELKKRIDISFLIVTLDVINEYPDLTDDLPIINCNVKFNLSIIKKNKFKIAEFEKIVQEFNPHIIHSHLYIAEIVSRITVFKKIIYFSHLQGFEDRFKPFSLKIFFHRNTFTNYYEKHWLVNSYLKCNNYFFAISKNTQSYYQKLLPAKLKNHIFFLPNAIPVNRYLAKTAKQHNYNLMRLISVGSLDKRKNHQFLLMVAEILKNKGIDFTLEILGEGVDRPLLEETIKSKGLTNKVFLRGNIINVETYLHQADFYVHSAPYEPFGLVIIEAMAAGLPVITLNGLGNKDLIINGYNGYLLESDNPQMFVEKLLMLYSDKEKYNSISANAITFAKQYDISLCTDNLIKYYKQVLQIT